MKEYSKGIYVKFKPEEVEFEVKEVELAYNKEGGIK